MKKTVMGLFCLLPVAFLTSMAAMETLSWLTFLVFLSVLGMDLKIKGKSALSDLKTGVDLPLWGFFFVLVISAWWNISDSKLRWDIIGDGRWILLFYAYAYLLKKYFSENFEKYLKVFAVVVALVGAYSLLQFLFGIEPTRDRKILKEWGSFYRATGLFSLPLTFAATMGMSAFLLSGTVVQSWKSGAGKWHPLRLLGIAFGFVGVIVSLTRGAWLAASVALLAGAFLVKKKWAAIALAVLVVFSGGLAMTSDLVQERITSVFDSQNRSNNLRFLVWQTNWEIIKQYPVAGVGLGQNKEYYYEIYEKLGADGETFKSHAHNNLLQIWSGMGTVGLVFFVWFCLWFLLKNAVLYKNLPESQVFLKGLALGLFAAQIHFHVGGLTECNFTDGEVNHLLIFLWALLVAIGTQRSWGAPERSAQI